MRKQMVLNGIPFNDLTFSIRHLGINEIIQYHFLYINITLLESGYSINKILMIQNNIKYYLYLRDKFIS